LNIHSNSIEVELNKRVKKVQIGNEKEAQEKIIRKINLKGAFVDLRQYEQTLYRSR